MPTLTTPHFSNTEFVDREASNPLEATAFGTQARTAALLVVLGVSGLTSGCSSVGEFLGVSDSTPKPVQLKSVADLSLSNREAVVVEGTFQFEHTTKVYGFYTDVSGKHPKIKYGGQDCHIYTVILSDNSKLKVTSEVALPLENNPLRIKGGVCKFTHSNPELGLCDVTLITAE